jgi:hypothetical protein
VQILQDVRRYFPHSGTPSMFQFTIRDVLWLTLVVGLSVGWWFDHRALGKRVSKFKADDQMRRAFDGMRVR